MPTSSTPTILGNIFTDITSALNGSQGSLTPDLIPLLGVVAGGISVFTGILKIKEAHEKPDELKKGLIYILVGSVLSGFVALNSMAGTTFFGQSISLDNMGWGANSNAPDAAKEALRFAVLIIRLVGVYCFFSALGSIKTFAHNQDHNSLNTAKVRFFSAILLVNFPLFVRALAITMGGDIGGKLLSWFPV